MQSILFSRFRAGALAVSLIALSACQSTNPEAIVEDLEPNPVAPIGGQVVGTGPVLVAALLPLSAGGANGVAATEISHAMMQATRDLGADVVSLKTYDTGGTSQGAAASFRQAQADQARLVVGLPLREEVAGIPKTSGDGNLPIIALTEQHGLGRSGALGIVSSEVDSAMAGIDYALAAGRKRFAIVTPRQMEGAERARLEAAIKQKGGTLADVLIVTSAPKLDERAVSALSSSDAVLFLGRNAAAPLKLAREEGAITGSTMILGTIEWPQDLITSALSAGAILPMIEQDGLRQVSARVQAASAKGASVMAIHGYDAVALASGLVRVGGKEALTREQLSQPAGFRGGTGKFRFGKGGAVHRLFSIYRAGAGKLELLDAAPQGF